MTATLTQPSSVSTPTHTELLGAFFELQGDLSALCDRFSLSGVQLLALLQDPRFRPRLNDVDEILARSTIRKLQTTSAEALTSAIKAATKSSELCRAGTNLARLTYHWGQLPSPPRPSRASRPTSDSTPTPTPTSLQSPAQSPPLNLSDLLAGVSPNNLDPQHQQTPPAPVLASVNVRPTTSKNATLVNLAGLVPRSRASSA